MPGRRWPVASGDADFAPYLAGKPADYRVDFPSAVQEVNPHNEMIGRESAQNARKMNLPRRM